MISLIHASGHSSYCIIHLISLWLYCTLVRADLVYQIQLSPVTPYDSDAYCSVRYTWQSHQLCTTMRSDNGTAIRLSITTVLHISLATVISNVSCCILTTSYYTRLYHIVEYEGFSIAGYSLCPVPYVVPSSNMYNSSRYYQYNREHCIIVYLSITWAYHSSVIVVGGNGTWVTRHYSTDSISSTYNT